MIEIGTKINSWTYIGRPENRKRGYGVFRCDCGETKTISVYTVVSEKSKSCKHCAWNRFGISKDEYNLIIYARRRAINRCYNPTYENYRRYGGRGLTVCQEWLDSQEAFVQWAINNGWKQGLSLDRIDNDKGYFPENCRWASAKEQARNKSSCIYLTHNGETKTMIEWCEEFHVPHWLPDNRWKRGIRNFDELFSFIDRGTGAMLHYRLGE